MAKDRNVEQLKWILLAVMILCILFSTVYMQYIWKEATDETTEFALNIASTSAAFFQPIEINKLEVGPGDIAKAPYIHMKNSLMELMRINSDARFAYVYTMRNGKIYFIADSEPVESKDYSPPGMEYVEASEEFLKTIIDGNDKNNDNAKNSSDKRCNPSILSSIYSEK